MRKVREVGQRCDRGDTSDTLPRISVVACARCAIQMHRLPAGGAGCEVIVFEVVADEQHFRRGEVQSLGDRGQEFWSRLAPADPRRDEEMLTAGQGGQRLADSVEPLVEVRGDAQRQAGGG